MIQLLSDLELKVINKDGLTEFCKHIKPDSLLKAYAQFLYGVMLGTGQTITDTGGTGRLFLYYDCLKGNAAAADATFGIVVGTSNQALAIADNKLVTQIAHGNGASQLYHQAQVMNAFNQGATSCYWTHQRNFNNNSGGDITIKEAGFYGKSYSAYIVCVARDLTGDVLVQNTKTFVATYTFTIAL